MRAGEKTLRFLAVLVVLAVPAASAPDKIVVEAKYGKSLRGTFDGYPILVLRGTHRERGTAHGVLAGREIIGQLDEVFLPAVKRMSGGAWDDRLLPVIRTSSWPPRYEQELSGMMAGIRKALPDRKDRLLKTLGREISLEDLKAVNAITDVHGLGCSSFSVWGTLTPDGRVLTGRNLDYTTFPGARMVILAIDPDEEGLESTLDVGGFGFIGAGTALNGDGAFLALHDAAGLPNRNTRGWVPRTIALRSAIEKARGTHAVEDVAEVLRGLPVRRGGNIHVSGPLGAGESPSVPGVLEWDGNPEGSGVTVRRSGRRPAAGALLCTNHYRLRGAPTPPKRCRRYSTLSGAVAKLASGRRRADLRTAKSMLDSVARNGNSVTYCSVVVWPGKRRYVVSLSPSQGVSATRGRWVTVDWDDIFGN